MAQNSSDQIMWMVRAGEGVNRIDDFLQKNIIASRLTFLLVFILMSGSLCAQSLKSKCGFYSKDSVSLRNGFEDYYQHLGVIDGEYVASVGAAAGSVELIISSYIKNVKWLLQDIDTSCLNIRVFNIFKKYNEQLLNRKIEGDFDFLIGSEKATNLPREQLDRIILVNVYHELTARQAIMEDIRGALKPTGVVAIQERMATKRGQKNRDCGHPKLFETDFIKEMDTYGFILEKKISAEEFSHLCYYLFRLK